MENGFNWKTSMFYFIFLTGYSSITDEGVINIKCISYRVDMTIRNRITTRTFDMKN